MMMMMLWDSIYTSVSAAGLLATRRGDVVADASVASLPSTHLDLHPVGEPLGGAAGPLEVMLLPVQHSLSVSLSLDASADEGLHQVDRAAMEDRAGASSKQQQTDSHLPTVAVK